MMPVVTDRTLRTIAWVATSAIWIGLISGAILSQSWSSPDFLSAVTATLLAWTAAVAGENLVEIRKARLAEFEPILVPFVPELIAPFRKQKLQVGIRNVGKGTALDLEVIVWRPESRDLTDWFPTTRDLHGRILEPGDHTDVEFPIRHRSLWNAQVSRGSSQGEAWDAPELVLEIRWIDALGNRGRALHTYIEVERPDQKHALLTRVTHLPLPHLSVSDRERTVRLQLREALRDMAEDLPEWSLEMNKVTCQLRFDDAHSESIMISTSANEPAEAIVFRLLEQMCRHQDRIGGPDPEKPGDAIADEQSRD